MPLRVAIIGAGPAGCMLARLLLHPPSNPNDVSVTVFESEHSLDFRSQGGTLDLHVKTGQLAIREAGLWDEFQKHVRYDGEAMQIADKKYLCYVRQGGGSVGGGGDGGTGRPEIDRPKLREMLFESLPEGTVKWGKKLREAGKGQEGLELRFVDGSVEGGFDLIVGADGAWSKVRPLVSDVKPFYSGIAGHFFTVPNAQQNHPDLYESVNRGSLFGFSDAKSITAQYIGDGSLHVSTWAVRPEDWQTSCGYDVRDAKAVKEACRRDFADWHPTLSAFTQKAEDVVVPRDLYMLPIGHKWEHVPGVTLVGDAAHLMTPFAGEGVNLAFEDCLKLSRAILSAASASTSDEVDMSAQLDTNVRAFEQDMFLRATATQQLTWDMMQAMYMTPGAPRKGIEKYIIRAVEGELGPVLTVMLTPVIYIWFFVFKLIW